MKIINLNKRLKFVKDNLFVEADSGFDCWAVTSDHQRFYLGWFCTIAELLSFSSTFVHRNDGMSVEVFKEISIRFRDTDGVKHTVFRENTLLSTLTTESDFCECDLPF